MTDQWFVDLCFALPLHQTFTYSVPAETKAALSPGVRVRAPFGRKRLVGYCVEVHDRPPAFQTKPIIEVVDEAPLLDAERVTLARWMSRYYLAPLGDVFEAMLPGGVRRNVSPETMRVAALGVARDEALAAVESLGRRSPKQKLVLEALLEAGRPLPVAELAKIAHTASSTVTALARKGLVAIEEARSSDGAAVSASEEAAPAVRPTPEQERALALITRGLASGRHQTVLLHGITGSGKTEVYLRAAAKALELGKDVLYLVPEIALTPQTVQRLRARFDPIEVFHSQLSDGERNAAWRRVHAGESHVVLGPRSAIFAPVKNLGLVVIDEEHEPTFKQETSPRYHARQVAVFRARQASATVVLGSATPALETHEAAAGGRFALAELPYRIERRPLPPVEIVDLRYDKGHLQYGANFSRELDLAIDDALSRGEQVLLFMNRRGFAATVHCPRCGHSFECPNCAVPMTYHKKTETLLCHYCQASMPTPNECPECGMENLSFRGRGTERIEHEMARRFPEARTLRMDSDAASRRDFYELAFEDFRNQRIDVLIGTQMIAKGLDFPNVTLVGVVLADVAMSLPDFRAGERTFQLLSQVGGRAGRGPKGGRVIIQTYSPDALPIEAARTHDYARFARSELEQRKLHGYPPFGRLIQVVASASKETAAAGALARFRSKLQVAIAGRPEVRILGPAPAPLPRLAGKYRYHLLVKYPRDFAIQEKLLPIVASQRKAGAAIVVDVDPQSVL